MLIHNINRLCRERQLWSSQSTLLPEIKPAIEKSETLLSTGVRKLWGCHQKKDSCKNHIEEPCCPRSGLSAEESHSLYWASGHTHCTVNTQASTDIFADFHVFQWINETKTCLSGRHRNVFSWLDGICEILESANRSFLAFVFLVKWAWKVTAAALSALQQHGSGRGKCPVWPMSSPVWPMSSPALIATMSWCCESYTMEGESDNIN